MAAFFFAIIPAVLAALPLFGGRFIPTHDGEYHIIRFWQFYKGLSGGNWFPRWAPDLNNGYGIPLFTFNYPFPNYIGSLFHFLGLSFVDSVKWTLASGYLLAVLFCFIWLKRQFDAKFAVFGTIVGAFVPYWFVDLYVRGSVGEVWALVWVFGVFAAIVYGSGFLLTITVTLLIVSHNILALIFVPVIFTYVVVYKRGLLRYVAFGIGAASYFWIPAIYEQRFITGISPVHVFDHFPAVHQLLIPSWGTGFRGAVGGGNEMSYQIGLIPIIVFLLAPKKKNIFFVLCFLFSVILMLPWTQYLWRVVPFVHFIQYPWRLLSIVVVVTPYLAASVVKRYRFGWIIAVCSILAVWGYIRPVTYEPRQDTHYFSQDNFSKGTSSLGNSFQTIWHADVESKATASGKFIVPIAYYPGWHVSVNQQSVEIVPSDTGLISYPAKEGSDVKVWFAATWWQQAAVLVSVLSLLLAFISFILKR